NVVKSLIEDGESFKARISPANMKYLDVEEGDFLLLKGTQSAVVPVGPSAPIIGSEAVIHLDPLTLSNAGTFLFSKVIVRKAKALPAREIVLIPEKPQLIKEERKAILKGRLQEAMVLTGNRITVSLGADKKDVFWVQATQPDGRFRWGPIPTWFSRRKPGKGAGKTPSVMSTSGAWRRRWSGSGRLWSCPCASRRSFPGWGLTPPREFCFMALRVRERP
ncbi:MAG: hypothetical protein EHM75_13230, partial [Desulfobacteraceae bacterium]